MLSLVRFDRKGNKGLCRISGEVVFLRGRVVPIADGSLENDIVSRVQEHLGSTSSGAVPVALCLRKRNCTRRSIRMVLN